MLVTALRYEQFLAFYRACILQFTFNVRACLCGLNLCGIVVLCKSQFV